MQIKDCGLSQRKGTRHFQSLFLIEFLLELLLKALLLTLPIFSLLRSNIDTQKVQDVFHLCDWHSKPKRLLTTMLLHMHFKVDPQLYLLPLT